ncbi:hypothetical protein ETAA8_28100 [Anatilimnocola aggregata]|uniref:Transposase Helix-turn-helix domain-containing protein n=1 Tax=Anatilimnocola aggregata TaxID=2528021 RepID=A0A517YBV3_9BACT|nr:hypothetical protein [Anatilimnocola aggregata]QDU27720.1 hypothetical protein ETAA8_28100 [Anatilimnocola aggregata]
MVADLKVPPSERDFQAFRLIKVEQRTTRAVAELLGILQTRVCQIVQRVLEFLIETAPTADDEARRAHWPRKWPRIALIFCFGWPCKVGKTRKVT